MIGNYGLKHFSNGGDAGSWKLEFSNRKEQLPQTARHIAVIMLAVLKIEVGEQKICPTAFLNSYSCCTQPYILTPLTLYYAFFGFCMKWRLHVISLTSCIVICVYTCIFKKKKCCVYSVVSFFFFHLKWALVKTLESTYTLAYIVMNKGCMSSSFWDHCTLPEEVSHEN